MGEFPFEATAPAVGLLDRALVGDGAALGRLLSLIEASPVQAGEVGRALAATPRTGHIVGLFGPPGVGKSTLIGRLISLLRQRDGTVGVLATDPTSAFSGGAILGDRVRMGGRALDEGVFIRSFAARDPTRSLGTVTAVACDLVARCYDHVLGA